MTFWVSPSHFKVKKHWFFLVSPLECLDPVFQHRTHLYHQRPPIVHNETKVVAEC